MGRGQAEQQGALGEIRRGDARLQDQHAGYVRCPDQGV